MPLQQNSGPMVQHDIATSSEQQPRQRIMFVHRQANKATRKYSTHYRKKSKVLGIIHIILGGLQFVLVIALFRGDFAILSFVIPALFGFVTAIGAGASGIIASSNPNRCKVLVTLVLSVICCIFMIALVTYAFLLIFIDFPFYGFIITLLGALADLGVGVIQSDFCRKALCSKKENPQIAEKFRSYHRKWSKAMGGTQIALAVLMIALNIWAAVAERYNSRYWVISTGWWASPIMITAGSFGIAAGFRPNNGTVITTMVLSIFSCVCMIAAFTQAGLGLSASGWWYSSDSVIAAYALFIMAALAEVGVGVTQSVLCGKVICSSNPAPQTYITNQGQTYSNGGYVPSYVNAQGGVTGQSIPMMNMQNMQQVSMQTSNVSMPTNVAMQNNMAMPAPPAYTSQESAAF